MHHITKCAVDSFGGERVHETAYSTTNKVQGCSRRLQKSCNTKALNCKATVDLYLTTLERLECSNGLLKLLPVSYEYHVLWPCGGLIIESHLVLGVDWVPMKSILLLTIIVPCLEGSAWHVHVQSLGSNPIWLPTKLHLGTAQLIMAGFHYAHDSSNFT